MYLRARREAENRCFHLPQAYLSLYARLRGVGSTEMRRRLQAENWGVAWRVGELGE
jgi:hypothetical protein